MSALISTPPTAKLFTLLTQAFPLHARQPDDKVTLEDFAEKDPKSWTHAQLEYWFRHIDRDVAPDDEWATKARACVHSHSELLWERIKGALGVPPELDVSEGEVEEDIGELDASVADFMLSPVDTTHNPDFSLADHIAGNYPDVFDDDFDSTPISIEPVFATDPNASPSVEPQVGLGDISEAAEEEAENVDTEEDTSSPPPKQEEVVHGLRISTSFSSPASHIHGNISSALASPIAIGGGASGGVTSLEGSYKLRRSSSSSSSIHIDGRLSPYFAYKGAHDDDYHAGIEREPGRPLFPSNFANLATSPTLLPKWVSCVLVHIKKERTDCAFRSTPRRSSLPHQPWNSNPHAIRMALAKRRGSNLGASEYAMTTASEGSVVGDAA